MLASSITERIAYLFHLRVILHFVMTVVAVQEPHRLTNVGVELLRIRPCQISLRLLRGRFVHTAQSVLALTHSLLNMFGGRLFLAFGLGSVGRLLVGFWLFFVRQLLQFPRLAFRDLSTMVDILNDFNMPDLLVCPLPSLLKLQCNILFKRVILMAIQLVITNVFQVFSNRSDTLFN